jgi:hypothetical protein
VLLPDKHIRLSESIIGLAALVLSNLPRFTTFDALWKKVGDQLDGPKWPAIHGVENFVLAICFLHAIGKVDVSEDGELFRCD